MSESLFLNKVADLRPTILHLFLQNTSGGCYWWYINGLMWNITIKREAKGNILEKTCYSLSPDTLFYKQHFSKHRHAEIGKKIKQMLGKPLRVNFGYLKTIHILHPYYHPTFIRHILQKKQKKQKNKCVYIHDIIRLIIITVKTTMKNRSHRYDTNRLRSRHGHKYSKYKNCLVMMILTCIKQHLSNIWNSIHEKVKQHWDWVERKRCL